MRKGISKLVLLAGFTLLLAGPALAASLTWVGCGITKKAFMKELAAAYKEKTGVSITIKGGGATKGIRAVAAGKADLGGSCRHKIDVPEEAAAKLHQVAWDAVVVVVNKDNPVSGVSLDQLREVLTGGITDWKDLGGTAGPLTLYVRKGTRSGVGLLARELLFGDPDRAFSPAARVMRSSGPLEAAISKDAGGIGLSGISSASRRKGLKMLSLDGVAPTKANLMSGAYPLVRPLYLVTRGDPQGEVKNFIDFALSPEGQAVIAAQGTVNLEEGEGLGSLARR